MIDMSNPEKKRLAELVIELLRIYKIGPDPEPLEKLREFIEKDWENQADLSYADMGELVFEAVMCTCETSIELPDGPAHNINCDMWDSKADPGDEEPS